MSNVGYLAKGTEGALLRMRSDTAGQGHQGLLAGQGELIDTQNKRKYATGGYGGGRHAGSASLQPQSMVTPAHQLSETICDDHARQPWV